MSDIEQYDKSRRVEFRSDRILPQIHARLPWNRAKAVRWTATAALILSLLAMAVFGWFFISDYQRIQARKTALVTIPSDQVWADCAAVEAAGIAPLFPGDPGFTIALDTNGNGIACEPPAMVSFRDLRWEWWRRLSESK